MGGAYSALFQGAVWNFHAHDFTTAIRPLTQSLTAATPLILAGLGVALGFRAGLFNIGGRGQMLAAAAGAGWVGFGMSMPWPLHMLVAMIVGTLAGAPVGGHRRAPQGAAPARTR